MIQRNNYLEDRADADEMIAEFGQAATLRRPTNSGPAWDPTITWAETGCTVVVTEFSNREVDGTRVLATDKKVLMAVPAIAPATSDRLAIGGVEYSIERVEPLAPGGVSVMFTLQARR